MEGVWMCTVVARVQRDPRKVCREGGVESLSAKGGGTGQTDPVEEREWLDEEDEEDMV